LIKEVNDPRVRRIGVATWNWCRNDTPKYIVYYVELTDELYLKIRFPAFVDPNACRIVLTVSILIRSPLNAS